MGVKNFTKFLTKYCPNVRCVVKYADCSGQTWGIDTSLFLHKFCHNVESKKPNPHIDGFYKLFYRLNKYNIKPFLVFDGEPSVLKDTTIERRRNVVEQQKRRIHTDTSASASATVKNLITISDDWKPDIIQLCHILNIKYIQADGEADILLSQLCKNGRLNAVLSEDYDMLMYGCTVSLSKFLWPKLELTCINLNDILDTLKITYEQFVKICVCLGTDYNDPICTLSNVVSFVKNIGDGPLPDNVEHVYQYVIDNSVNSAIDTINSVSVDSVDTIDTNTINTDALISLLTTKCKYRKSTVERHINTEWLNETT